MYSEVILDYYRHPRNFGKIENPDATARDVNTSCGDVIEVQLQIENSKVKDIKFTGKGCAISLASTSMLMEYVEGKKVEEILKITSDEMLELLGIKLTPMRLRCALLGLKVAKLAACQYLGKKLDEKESLD